MQLTYTLPPILLYLACYLPWNYLARMQMTPVVGQSKSLGVKSLQCDLELDQTCRFQLGVVGRAGMY